MPEPAVYTVRCPSCRTKNRVPAQRISEGPKCGKCGAPLALDDLGRSGPVKVTDANFESQVLKSPLPVLLDCWAAWCGPCRTLGPVIDQLARQWQGRIRVGKLNVDENPQSASKFQVRSIPTMLVFENGALKDTLVGALPQQEIARKMGPYL